MTAIERLVTVLFVVLLLALSQPALAAPPIFVGNGTPASCTETALKDALPAKATASALGHGPERAVDRRPWSRRSLCSAKSLDDQDWSANFWNEWQLSGT